MKYQNITLLSIKLLNNVKRSYTPQNHSNHRRESRNQSKNDSRSSRNKSNYCIQALIEKGCLKVNNFNNSNNKFAYIYLLTPTGIVEKALLTIRYLKRKVSEYEKLKKEIDELSNKID